MVPPAVVDGPLNPHLSGSNAKPLVSRYSCRATLCRLFRLTFSQCRKRIVLQPLECLKKGAVAPVWGGGGVASQLCTIKIIKLRRGTGGVAATVSQVALHCDTKTPTTMLHQRFSLLRLSSVNIFSLALPLYGLIRQPLPMPLMAMLLLSPLRLRFPVELLGPTAPIKQLHLQPSVLVFTTGDLRLVCIMSCFPLRLSDPPKVYFRNSHLTGFAETQLCLLLNV